MQSHEIRERFLKFFERRGHTIIPSASLIPENDPSVLFNTAGMQPLVPYLLGAPYPSGAKRLADSQKCVRTVDIDEIGDNTHATFFEMLGNWSLGDYFKEDAIKWSFEFLTDKEEGLGLDPCRLYVTVFEGDENAPKDTEAFEIWKKYIPERRIYFMSAKSNWWSPGDNGPSGPDTEMFYDVTPDGLGDLTREEYLKADDEQKVVEIWNDVFMEYEKKDGKVIGKLSQKNVDTGSGLERVAMVVQGKNNIYDTDLLASIVERIRNQESGIRNDERAERIIADHVRTAVFLIADGVTPSRSDRGYVLRRLLRRAIYHSDRLELSAGLQSLVDVIVQIYQKTYPNLVINSIKEVIENEEKSFRRVIKRAYDTFEQIKELKKRIDFVKTQQEGSSLSDVHEPGIRTYFKDNKTINGRAAFNMLQTDGVPIDLIKDFAKENDFDIDMDDYGERFRKHQEISRAGSEQKFKGGLADHSEISTRYHTATHLLHKALREVLGDHVFQKGSNITAERMRFDFSHGEKMTDEQKQKVEDLVNEKIKEALPVSYEDISIEEAKRHGAMGLFGDKYGEIVRVYTVGEKNSPFSMELCGGPHVKNTSELGHFKILKEEAVSAGVRRIKAILD